MSRDAYGVDAAGGLMEESRSRPSWEVEVKIAFGHPNYVMLAEWVYGDDAGPWWQELGDLLGGRPGWHCELTSSGLLWSFGALGSSLFNVTWHGADGDLAVGYELFDYDADETLRFDTTGELRAWLEANEHRHADHLRTKLRGWVVHDDWKLLKSFPWVARVSHEGHSWVGTVDGIPSEATFAASLASLLGQLRELIATAFDATPDVAPEISLSVRLDEAATRAADS